MIHRGPPQLLAQSGTDLVVDHRLNNGAEHAARPLITPEFPSTCSLWTFYTKFHHIILRRRAAGYGHLVTDKAYLRTNEAADKQRVTCGCAKILGRNDRFHPAQSSSLTKKREIQQKLSDRALVQISLHLFVLLQIKHSYT
jgi:hypothetical protein